MIINLFFSPQSLHRKAGLPVQFGLNRKKFNIGFSLPKACTVNRDFLFNSEYVLKQHFLELSTPFSLPKACTEKQDFLFNSEYDLDGYLEIDIIPNSD